MNITALRGAADIVRSRFFRRPFYVHIYPTRRCNLQCRMCGVWQYGNREEEMPAEKWRTILAILKREGVAHIVITGGEPLLYDGMPELVRFIRDANIDVRLQSNAGFHVTDKTLLALTQAGLKHLTVSLDSLHPAVHDDISHCPGLQEHVVHILKQAVPLFQEGMVVVNTVVSSRNLAELPDIAAFTTGIGAYSSLVPVHLSRGEPELIRGHDASFGPCAPEQVNAVYDRLEEMKRQGYHIAHSDRFLKASRRYLITGDCSWRCDAGELYFSVFPDGSISPCDDFPAEHNLLNPSFDFGAFRTASRRRRTRCPGCIWGCWRETSYMVTRMGTALDWAGSYFRWRMKGTGGAA